MILQPSNCVPPLTDYHTHNFRCFHAEGDIEDYAARALELGFKEIGASDHIPVSKPHYQGYRMKRDTLPEYRERVLSVRRQLRGKLEVLYGIEAEYDEDPQTIREGEQIMACEAFDYVIGSVHFFNGRDGNGIRGAVWDVVPAVGRTERDELLVRYFGLVREMAHTRAYDIVGHFDIVVRHMGWETDPKGLIEKSICCALDEIAEAKMTMEVNTSGRRYGNGQTFPSPWILRKALERGIPLMINSDAHAPDQVGAWHHETFVEILAYGMPVQFARYRNRQRLL